MSQLEKEQQIIEKEVDISKTNNGTDASSLHGQSQSNSQSVKQEEKDKAEQIQNQIMMRQQVKNIAFQLKISELEVIQYLKFKNLVANYVEHTKFTIQSPSLILLSIIKQQWKVRRIFGEDKTIDLFINKVAPQMIQQIKKIYSASPSVILIINGDIEITEGILKKQNQVYYQGNQKQMIILWLESGGRYNGQSLIQDNKIEPHGDGMLQIYGTKFVITYQGYFQNGKKHGFGYQKGKNSFYQGQWQNDKKSGYGRESTLLKKKKIKKIMQNMKSQEGSLMSQSEQSFKKKVEQQPVLKKKQKQIKKKKQSKLDDIDCSDDEYIEQGDIKKEEEEQLQEKSVTTEKQSEKEGFPTVLPLELKQMYSGNFEDGKKSGQGAELSRFGKYDGEWSEGLKHGKGKIQYNSGATYDGQWRQGLISGQGTYIDQANNVYEGQFQNGHRHGTGNMIFGNGDTYDGGWQLGKKHGQGIYTYFGDEGDYYDGQWDQDFAQGQGTSMINGLFYSGTFLKGMKHGIGEQTDLSGDGFKGIWENNQLVQKMDQQ